MIVLRELSCVKQGQRKRRFYRVVNKTFLKMLLHKYKPVATNIKYMPHIYIYARKDNLLNGADDCCKMSIVAKC